MPALIAVYRFATVPAIWPGDLLHPTGEWSARFIIVALMLTPLAQLFPSSRAVRWLVRHRRAFGVAGFAYAMLHLVFYVLDMETVAAILAEIGAPAICDWLACFAVPGAACHHQQ